MGLSPRFLPAGISGCFGRRGDLGDSSIGETAALRRGDRRNIQAVLFGELNGGADREFSADHDVIGASGQIGRTRRLSPSHNIPNNALIEVSDLGNGRKFGFERNKDGRDNREVINTANASQYLGWITSEGEIVVNMFTVSGLRQRRQDRRQAEDFPTEAWGSASGRISVF